MKRLFQMIAAALFLAAVTVCVTACSIAAYDPITVQNIQAIQANQEACVQAIAHETSKSKPDAETIKGLTALCDCYKHSGDPVFVKRTCDSTVLVLIDHEHKKQGPNPPAAGGGGTP